MTKISQIIFIIFVSLLATQHSQADILAEGQDWREIPFTVIDFKPFLNATIGNTTGTMMFDTGTPEPVFLNRHALDLLEGPTIGKGQAASGQAIEVQLHDAPRIVLGEQQLEIGLKVPSGNFDFVEIAYGADYLGFIGAPIVQNGAFLLDYGRQVLTVLRTQPNGSLIVSSPAQKDVLAVLTFAIAKGEQPTSGAFIGNLPIVLDFDTGDTGTLHLTLKTQKRLEAEGFLVVTNKNLTIKAATFGGKEFQELSISRLVEAGTVEDIRPWPGSDSLRLGGAFFAKYPSLWNYPARTLTILRPGSDFLKPR